MLAVGNRVLMVSGANRGIGRALAVGLLAKGYRLSLGARRPETLADIASGAAERVLAVAYDALEHASAGAWVDATLARFGRIDGLINNAGALRHATIEEGRDEVRASPAGQRARAAAPDARRALPHLKRCGTGRIVNVVSPVRQVVTPGCGSGPGKPQGLSCPAARRRARSG